MVEVPTMEMFDRLLGTVDRLEEALAALRGTGATAGPCGAYVPVEDLMEALRLLGQAKGCLLVAPKLSGAALLRGFPNTIAAIGTFVEEMGGKNGSSTAKTLGQGPHRGSEEEEIHDVRPHVSVEDAGTEG